MASYVLIIACVILLCELAENICAIALLFIMFYGGFNTNWHVAVFGLMMPFKCSIRQCLLKTFQAHL